MRPTLVLPLALLLACGDHGRSTTSPEDAFYSALHDRVCAAQAACCRSSGAQPATCDDVSDGSNHRGNPGSLGETFNEAAAASCLATLDATTFASPSFCSNPTPASADLLTACPDLYVGGRYHATPLGGECALEADQAGFYPAEDSERCAPPPGSGAGCVQWTTESAAGRTRWSACVAQVEIGGVGDYSCEDSAPRCFYADRLIGSLPATLRVSTHCAAGLRTLRAICILPIAVGQPCEPETCADGLYCDLKSATCAPLPPVGQPCTPDLECAQGAACDRPSAVCVPILSQGAKCMGSGICAAGLQCLGTCQPLGAAGDACDATRACGDGLFCHVASSTCRAPQGLGAPCAGGDECASLRCVQGACTSPPARGPRPGCAS
jgi:hypothetical protein